MSTGSIALTLLVPCFDEGPRMDRCLSAVCEWSRRRDGVALEVLCVDDGSRDDTVQRVAAWARRWSVVRLLALERNRGKGAALKAGMAAASGEAVVFLDADLAVDLRHLDGALALLQGGADVVVGCRNVPGATVERAQRLPRRLLGRGYRRLARLFLGLRVADVTCGFKGFRRDVGRMLFERAACRRWGFDAEILFLAQRAGCVIRELPVHWFDGEASSVRLRRDVPGAFMELVGTRLRHCLRSVPRVSRTAPTARPQSVTAASAREAGWS